MQASADAPCTVGNCGPGFDVLSLALARRGDTVSLTTADADTVSVRGAGAERVPTDWAKNSACAVIDDLRRRTSLSTPLAISIQKGMPPGSGLGSSASSNAATVRAFAKLFRTTLTARDALGAAAQGEAVASGVAHMDDVAAALLGGLTIVGGDTDAIVRVRPPSVHLVVARPELDLPTREMRALLPEAWPRRAVIANLSRVARIVAACQLQDGAMFCRALDDDLARPYRAPKVPHFEEAHQAAKRAGAVGFLLSGSGPAMIAALPTSKDPALVEAALRDVFSKAGQACEIFLTKPAAEVVGAEIKYP